MYSMQYSTPYCTQKIMCPYSTTHRTAHSTSRSKLIAGCTMRPRTGPLTNTLTIGRALPHRAGTSLSGRTTSLRPSSACMPTMSCFRVPGPSPTPPPATLAPETTPPALAPDPPPPVLAPEPPPHPATLLWVRVRPAAPTAAARKLGRTATPRYRI